MSVSRRQLRSDGARRLLPADDLADLFGPVAADYATAVRLARGLPRRDAERLLQKRRGAYLWAMGHALRTAAWLTDEVPS